MVQKMCSSETANPRELDAEEDNRDVEDPFQYLDEEDADSIASFSDHEVKK